MLFASEYPRNEQGHIIFPSDKGGYKRLKMFPVSPELLEHPAKATTTMIESIVDYVSKPGETVMVTEEILAEMDKEVDWCSH